MYDRLMLNAAPDPFVMFQLMNKSCIYMQACYCWINNVCLCVAEGEQEKEWLQDAGLSTLISEDLEDVDNVGLLSTLTRTQAAAVQRRLDTYTCSVRKKNKQPVRDVRDIFRADNPKVKRGASLLKSSLYFVLDNNNWATPWICNGESTGSH